MDGLFFLSDMPKIVLLEGGFFTPSDHAYHFQVTDRQGNVRLVTGAGGTVEQSYDYHPYGEEFSAQALTGPANAWRYGGKEKETVVGTRPQYDFGARRMSPAYGRFITMDPLGEKYYHISPYAYCAGDPVNYVDPTGMDWIMACYDGEVFLYYDDRIHNQEDIISVYYDNKDRKKYDIVYVGEFASFQSSDGTGFSLNSDGSYTDKEGNTTFEEYAEDGVLHIGNSKNTVQEKDSNWYGTYTGPRNPKDANNPKIDSYAKPPIDALDYAAFRHDKGYDAVGAQGKTDAIMNVCTVPADHRLIIESIMSVGKGANVIYALGTASIFSVLSGFKSTHPRLTIIPLILHQYEK